jgi:plastocyanin
MHPANVASAGWVFAAAPSKGPFYAVGAALVAWAVLLAAFGVTHPDFPRSEGRARLLMLTTALLVGGTITAAVLTAGGAGHKAQAQPAAATLTLAADPSGALSYDVRHASLKAGDDTIRFVNRSPIQHNVTIAQGSKIVAATKTITSATTTVAAKLSPGAYAFYCSVDAHRQGGMEGTLTVK